MEILITALICAAAAAVVLIIQAHFAKKQRIKVNVLAVEARLEANDLRRELDEVYEELSCVREEQTRFQNQISHELRVPVSIIQGYADIVGDGLADDRETEKQYMKKISEKAGELTQMIQSMLTAARFDNDTLKLELRKCDLNNIISSAVSDLEASLEKNGITAKLQLPEAPVFVNADSVKLRQVFYNILDNSVKYMGRSGEINVTCSYNDGVAYVIFHDDGMGMSAENAEHIFERSYRGENAVKSAKSGTGLGMYITQAFVELHNGTVSAKSNAGEGMTVIISLPAEL